MLVTIVVRAKPSWPSLRTIMDAAAARITELEAELAKLKRDATLPSSAAPSDAPRNVGAESSDEEDVPLSLRIRSNALTETPSAVTSKQAAASQPAARVTAPESLSAAPQSGVILFPVNFDSLIGAEKVAFEALRQWRAAEADGTDVKRHWIASDAALCEMARRLPTTIEELGSVPAMGHGARTSKYGAMLIEALQPHVAAVRATHAKYINQHGAPLGALTDADKAVLAALTAFRDDLKLQSDVWVADNLTLREIVMKMPSSLSELAACKGLGARRVDAYGAKLLEVLEPHRCLVKARPVAAKRPRGR